MKIRQKDNKSILDSIILTKYKLIRNLLYKINLCRIHNFRIYNLSYLYQ